MSIFSISLLIHTHIYTAGLLRLLVLLLVVIALVDADGVAVGGRGDVGGLDLQYVPHKIPHRLVDVHVVLRRGGEPAMWLC